MYIICTTSLDTVAYIFTHGVNGVENLNFVIGLSRAKIAT